MLCLLIKLSSKILLAITKDYPTSIPYTPAYIFIEFIAKVFINEHIIRLN